MMIKKIIIIVEFCDHLLKHGDGVKDIAMEVEDLTAIYNVSNRNTY